MCSTRRSLPDRAASGARSLLCRRAAGGSTRNGLRIWRRGRGDVDLRPLRGRRRAGDRGARDRGGEPRRFRAVGRRAGGDRADRRLRAAVAGGRRPRRDAGRGELCRAVCSNIRTITRPQVWQGRAVPEVLVSGDHRRIRGWRRAQAERLTRERRPDLWERHSAARRSSSGDGDQRGESDESSAATRARAGRKSSRPTGRSQEFQPGDTVRVSVKVVEGERERIQAFEGVCIARKNAGMNSNFTLRKISYGEGVERVFPLLFAAHHRDRGGAPRRRAPGQALLPARPPRQGARIAERARDSVRRRRQRRRAAEAHSRNPDRPPRWPPRANQAE